MRVSDLLGFAFVIGLVLLPVLAWIEAVHFIRYEGQLRRGMKVGRGSLPHDVLHFLQNLPEDLFQEGTRAFIKKEENIVLIQPIPRLLYRGFSFWYIGYVNLAEKDPKIDYHAPISLVVWLVIVLIMMLGTAFGSADEVFRFRVILVFYVTLIVVFHYLSKPRVLRFIRERMEEERA